MCNKSTQFHSFLLNKCFLPKFTSIITVFQKGREETFFELLFQYEGERNSPLLGSAELTRHSFCESNKNSPVLLKGTSLNSYP